MARIIENTEEHGLDRIRPLGTRPHTKGGAVTAAAAEIGELLGCKYLITFTRVRRLGPAACRGCARASRCSPSPRTSATRSQLALTWGVETFLVADAAAHRRDGDARSTSCCSAAGRVVEGDLVVIVAGSPPGIPGSTNALRVHRIGDAKNRVAPGLQRHRERGRLRPGVGRR